jgi:hypothetical protein
LGYVRLNDDAIWATRIEGDDSLRKHLLDLPAGASVELEVDGTVGTWVKMKDGKDGRPTAGIRPVGPMRDTWRAMQARRGEFLRIRRAANVASSLREMRSLFEEWDTPEDEEAFGDLPLR